MKRLFLILVLIVLPTVLHAEDKDKNKEKEKKEREYHTVTKVIDGMTLELDGKETVRLIGASTPDPNSGNEVVRQWAEKSKEFTTSLLEGREVWLEYADKKTDDQGRTWAFVFFSAGLKQMQPLIDRSFIPFWGTAGNFMLNRLLVQFGFATVKSPFSFKFRSQFMELEKRARQNQYGMWRDMKY